MRRVQFTAFLFFLCSFYVQCVPFTTWAVAPIEKQQVNRRCFFPYNCCILVRIEDVRRPTAKNCGPRSELITKVTVKKVLRGKFKPEDELILAIKEEDAEYLLNVATGKRLAGQTCILAFNIHRFDLNLIKGRHLRISNLYCPLIGTSLTEASVAELQESLNDAPFQYKSCIAFTILGIVDKKIRHESKGTQRPVRLVHVRIDEILSDNRSALKKGVTPDIQIARLKSRTLRVGESILCNLGSDPPREIFPKQKMSDWPGTRCIWSFNPKEDVVEENMVVLNLDQVSAPFPFQEYNAVDLDQLKARLAIDSNRYCGLVEDVQSYVKETCTIDRLKRFCQLENRCSGSFRRFPCGTDNEILYAPLFSSEVEADEHGSDFQNATWFANVVDGVPLSYEVLIDRGGANRWMFHAPFSLRAYDDEFVRERIFQTIQFGIVNFQNRHHSDGLATGLKGIVLIPPGKLLRDSKQRIVGYSCCLSNGKSLHIVLDEELRVSKVLVPGDLNKLIEHAVETTVENWDWCWAQESGS